MIQDQDLLKRIMGAPDSVTAKLIALRKDPTDAILEPGVWYSNFTRVKTEAESRGLPFVAMWTNGDLCGFCRRFTNSIIYPTFVDWMSVSGALFWLGGSMDDNEEDKRGGKGFVWCRGPELKVNYFPFVSVTKRNQDGNYAYRFHASGNDYDDKRPYPEGTPLIIIKMHNIMEPDNQIEAFDIEKEIEAKKANATASAKPVEVPAPVLKTGSQRLSIRFNSDWDSNHVARFHMSISENGGYCPCRADKNSGTKCMCSDFTSMNKPGLCRCGVFEKYYA